MQLSHSKGVYRQAFADGLRPDPLLSVSEWADKYRVLGTVASAEAGQWRTSRTPYLKEIMDCLSATDPTETVTLVKASQIGGSEAGNNWIGYIVDQAPGPCMIVQPTVDVAKRYSKQRIDPMINESPRLRNKIKPSRSRDSGNTILVKEFPGGILLLTGANSAVGLRSMPARYLFFDEVDEYPGDVDEEGDPIDLAEVRSRTFSRRKKFKVSSPKIAGRSKIQKSYEKSDQCKLEVPCPHCDHYQELVWKNVKWPKGKPDEATYQCEHCERLIQEYHKTEMLAKYRWVARNPDRQDKKHRGFQIGGLYSPLGWLSWATCAVLWEEAQGDQDKLRVFVNTVLGEPWKDKGEAPEWERLYERRELYEFNQVPANGIFITAGVDVQKDRLECEIVAWGRDKQSWSLDYRVYPGDTSQEACWKELFKILEEHFACADGTRIPVRMMAIDSGFNTQEVYNQVRKYPANRVIAVKGSDSQQQVIGAPSAVDIDLRGRKIRRGSRVWPVGSSMIKTELYGWLRLAVPTKENEAYPPGYCHFPQYGDDFFQKLTAEELGLKRTRSGGYRYYWNKIRERNEALDCRIYARAAAALVGLDRMKDEQWDQLKNSTIAVSKENGKPHRTIKRRPSTYW